MMTRSIATFGLVVATAWPVWTQAPAGADDPAKPQVQTFEMVLRSAVDRGGQNFAKRASQVVPVVVSPGNAPIVSGVVVRELNLFVFEVQVPGIWQTSLVLSMLRGPQGPPQPVQPVASPGPGSGRVSATTVEPDPMATTPVAGSFDPDREYSYEVRDALIESVFDNAGVLPLGATDSLVIIAGGNDPPVPNPFYRQTPRKLVLSIKGSDLLDFRQGRLTREEARRRVKESHF